MNIYVGNLSYETSENDLKVAFEAFGAVETVKIIKDKFTGDSKGFGFVEMPNGKEAQSAMEGVKEIQGRQLVINEARPQVRHRTDGGRGGSHRSKNFGRRDRGY